MNISEERRRFPSLREPQAFPISLSVTRGLFPLSNPRLGENLPESTTFPLPDRPSHRILGPTEQGAKPGTLKEDTPWRSCAWARGSRGIERNWASPRCPGPSPGRHQSGRQQVGGRRLLPGYPAAAGAGGRPGPEPGRPLRPGDAGAPEGRETGGGREGGDRPHRHRGEAALGG